VKGKEPKTHLKDPGFPGRKARQKDYCGKRLVAFWRRVKGTGKRKREKSRGKGRLERVNFIPSIRRYPEVEKGKKKGGKEKKTI